MGGIIGNRLKVKLLLFLERNHRPYGKYLI